MTHTYTPRLHLTGCWHSDVNPNAQTIREALETGRIWIDGPLQVCEDALRRP
jgi:hypothetical protein